MPTRDSRPLIAHSVPLLQEWLPKAGEVIVVDSNSTDGTRELIESAFPYPNVQIHNRPPGLYAAWNFGIQTASRPITYISTAGDAISERDLATLNSVFTSHPHVDVVVSSPRFLDGDCQPTPGKVWPIHKLWTDEVDQDVIQLSGPDLVAFALKAAHPPYYNNWLCSSASNLYRTEFLKSHPFPENAGHGADTLFGIQNARHMKAAFYRHCCGTFVVHEKSSNAHHLSADEIFDLYFLRGYQEELRWLVEQTAPDSSAYVKDLLLNLEPGYEIHKRSLPTVRVSLLEDENGRLRARNQALQEKVAQLKEHNASLKGQLAQVKIDGKQNDFALKKIPKFLRRWLA
ncbi:glycosyltransferase [Verrucomicrobium spinosum]|uniref:glycosyltransferase n=1 Tax=Verrucomicrobium spinosum TaxID=2736 RepID=UPI00155DD242|nr:glycosyltransferase [Verrucomicrobium spinosum]